MLTTSEGMFTLAESRPRVRCPQKGTLGSFSESGLSALSSRRRASFLALWLLVEATEDTKSPESRTEERVRTQHPLYETALAGLSGSHSLSKFW